jgi:hypothetical protein
MQAYTDLGTKNSPQKKKKKKNPTTQKAIFTPILDYNTAKRNMGGKDSSESGN